MFSGEGEITYKDKHHCKGFFQDNKLNGKGECRFNNDFSYKGSFKQGEFNGEGVLSYNDKEIFYEGTFLNGLMTGKGKFVHKKVKYVGNFLNG